jgi:hypothetical protein
MASNSDCHVMTAEATNCSQALLPVDTVRLLLLSLHLDGLPITVINAICLWSDVHTRLLEHQIFFLTVTYRSHLKRTGF